MQLIRYFLLFGIGTMLVFLLLGYVAYLHPLFDSLNHFRLYFLFCLIVLLFLALLFFSKKRRFLLLGSLLFLLAYTLWFIRPFSPKSMLLDGAKTLHMMQFNLNFRNKEMSRLKHYLRQSEIEVVTLQEVTAKHKEALETLKDLFPYQTYCDFQAVGGVAILSKFPFVSGSLVCGKDGLVKVRIKAKDKDINIISIHLYWPYPHTQYAQVQRLKSVLSKLKGSTVIAGDFNAVAWSHTTEMIEQASDTNVVEGLRFSINLPKIIPFLPRLMLPIDQVLVSRDLEVFDIFVEKSLGSDHLPIISTIVY